MLVHHSPPLHPPHPALSLLPGAISVQDSSSLDFEASPRLRLVVQAETAASFGFMAINLNLQDVNDNLPRFQLQNYVAFIWESQSYDSPVIQVSLVAQTGTSGPLGCLSAGVRGWGPVPWAWGWHLRIGLALEDCGLQGSTTALLNLSCGFGRSWQMIWIRERMGR